MKENKPVDPYAKYNEQSNIIAKIIFASRWLQV
ncbi:TPA: TIGR00645 family protein, partial [Haemophilus influenzae]